MTSLLQSRRALYVGGLSLEVGETTLRAAMIPFGPIKSIDIPPDYSNKNSHKGFGFVEFEDADDAAEAIFNMDGAELMGKVLNVSLAQPNQIDSDRNKAVWSTDEWFQKQAGIETEEDIKQKEIEQQEINQLKEQVTMT
mmetsp:Transcript_14827/g.21883  ORF Transcript_14827/g.21883 Transcript_14827/m.21883 type:complete len:139 (+) Transcript_14827:126-542(+)|eukprot:CAMPEP_0194200086 /NCGR_PEP_ID=MMETSP0156-20130528/853_1 /TAXON_ID=33649 /ORGANISM="Thalassionema nitzschioides, Strain L26-B" /LENGTH=138 /DNA_ID=CAMNT_0038925053 /DNA_START=73 /DNA_END=489 /DNA_ORIENTATION=+